ncbi:MAG: replication initiation protein [Burkholderiaceae bacterium]
MERTQHIVTRPNETIGIVPNGKLRITHLVRRLYSVILLFSQQQGEQEQYSALLSDMLAAANSPGSNRTQVKEILRDIRAIGIDWNVRDGDREIWKNVGLIEEPGLIDGKGTPTIVTWKLPKIIRARLLDPRGFFTRISLEMMTRLRSGASIALYEICCQYVSNDQGRGEGGLTNRGSIAEWMPRLTGSKKADYEYKFLKRDVVKTAIAEINEITDLQVELIEHKVGRRVGELQFRVFRKQVLDSNLPAPLTVDGASEPDHGGEDADAETLQLRRLLAFGAPMTVARRMCRKFSHDPQYLLRHLDFVETRARNSTTAPLLNKMAFLQKALEHGYADAIVSHTTLVPAPALVSAVTPRSRLPHLTEPHALPVSFESIQVEQQKLARRASVWQRFQEMGNDAAKTAIVDAFLEQTSATLKTFYRKNGVNNMIVKASLTDWLIAEQGF